MSIFAQAAAEELVKSELKGQASTQQALISMGVATALVAACLLLTCESNVILSGGSRLASHVLHVCAVMIQQYDILMIVC